MKVAAFGATGRLGRHVVRQALMAGYEIRALVRRPEYAGLASPVRMIAGDARDREAVAETIDSVDAVVSCLGAKMAATFSRNGRIAASGTNTIVEVMQERGVRRLVAVSTYGAGESWFRLTFGARLMMRTLLFGELADKNAMEAAIERSHLDWTIVRPVNLEDGVPSGRVSTDPPDQIGLRTWVTRADIAAFMLAALRDRRSMKRIFLLTGGEG